jgi:hypothetical protein
MLMVQRFVQEEAPNAFASEHSFYEGLELDVAMVEISRNWTTKLKLVGLEAVRC